MSALKHFTSVLKTFRLELVYCLLAANNRVFSPARSRKLKQESKAAKAAKRDAQQAAVASVTSLANSGKENTKVSIAAFLNTC